MFRSPENHAPLATAAVPCYPDGMTLHDFISKWRKVELKERSAAQEHFIDLCRVFDHPTPAEADPTGEIFCLE